MDSIKGFVGMSEMIENILNGKTLIDSLNNNQLEQAKNELVHFQDRLISESNFLEAQNVSNFIEQINTKAILFDYCGLKKQKLLDLNLKLVSTKDQLLLLKSKKIEIEKKHAESKVLAFDKFENECIRQITDLKNSEASPTPEFLKFSPEYLELRKKEESLVASKRFYDAVSIKKEADEKEKLEKKIQKKKYEDFISRQIELLKAKHQHQRHCLEVKWLRKLNEMNASINSDITKFEKAINTIRSRIDDLKSNKKKIGLEKPECRSAPLMNRARTATYRMPTNQARIFTPKS